MDDVKMLDGQTLSVGATVRLGCSCHTDQQGRVTGFRHNDLAEIRLTSGDDVCLPIHLLDLA